ncbi:hypothetical protein CVT24_010885 [Panaeolus cyanescens]|uniref:Uncharacterized protein n=1 Tax=Panaeolus cyanescens TaxID=181874 RepID=A0A409WDX2_9AGAR|nr:hypothetical protein CVT24_010885 [Panaeolus cyanescens]
MSTPSTTLPAELPSVEDVNCLLKLVSDKKCLFSMRLLYLNSAVEAALLWRPYADLIRDDNDRVGLICELRAAYYKLEGEAKYSLHQPTRDFKFPKQYHSNAEFTKAVLPFTETIDKSNPPTSTTTVASSSQAPSVTPTPAPATTPGPNVPTEPAADRNQGNRRGRGPRTKTPKFVPDGADDSDIDITIPKNVSTATTAPKNPTAASDGDIVMADAGVTDAAPASVSASASAPSEPKAVTSGSPTPSSSRSSSSKASSSSTPAPAKPEVCVLPYTEVPGLDLTSSSYRKLKSLPSFRSSGLGKRTRLDDSTSLGARNAVADLEAEVKYLDVRISVLTRTRDHLRALIDAL